MTIEFVRSAASVEGLPSDGLRELALVGRSNVGKSTLINALARQRVARAGAAPGTTRLANVYRVTEGGLPPFYLVDLPGYGYARGGDASAREFDALTRAYFRREGVNALLLVDARHPGLAQDVAAWRWVRTAVVDPAVVATKIDKLARGERIRAMRLWESVLEDSVLPVSAATGEGLKDLWTLIDRLLNRRPRRPRGHPEKAPSRRPPRNA